MLFTPSVWVTGDWRIERLTTLHFWSNVLLTATSHLHVFCITAVKYPSSVFTCILYVFAHMFCVFCSCMNFGGKHRKCPASSVSIFALPLGPCKQITEGGLLSLDLLSLNEKTGPRWVLCRVGVTLHLSLLSGILDEETSSGSQLPFHLV